MAIYPDKRAGQLTGRFRVELQRGTDRYRKRHDSYKAAQEDEKRVLDLWDRGVTDVSLEASQAAPDGITFTQGLELAEGRLWAGMATELGNFVNLRVIERSIGGSTLLDAIDTDTILKLKRALKERGVADGTVNRYLSHFKTFLTWQLKNGNRTVPLDKIEWEWRKESRGRIRWITYDEEAKLLELLPTDTADLVKVAIETGCRREELMSGKLHQVDQEGEEDGLFHIWKTKNNDPRAVPISADTARRLRSLFGGKMPSKRSLRRHWDKAKKTMGLETDDEFVFHTCRHTCATRMVDADVDILIIKQWLGHKRIETTQRYAKVKPKKLKSILARVGGLRAMETGKPSISAVPHAPPPSSPSGETAPLDRAA